MQYKGVINNKVNITHTNLRMYNFFNLIIKIDIFEDIFLKN